MTAAQNQARRAVGVPDLHWSARLTATAQSWADTLHRRGCAMQHSATPSLGENLAWTYGRHMRPADVVAMWLGEARNYDRIAGRCVPGAVCGHYMQVVWRGSRDLGCGMAMCGPAEVWVCNYSPPGNYAGERPY